VAEKKAHNTLGKHEQIGGATWVVGVFSVLMIGIGAARDMVTAAFFGASDAIDAFMLAFTISICVYGILTSVIDTAFLPLYTERLQKRHSNPSSLLYSVSLATSAFLIVASAILILLVPYYVPLIARGFSGTKLLMTERFCQALLALVFLNGLASLFKAVHNAHLKFALPSFTNILVPLCALLFLLVFRRSMGVWSLVLGTIFGTLLKLVVMGPLVYDEMRQDGPGGLRGAELKSIFTFSALAAPLALGAAFTQVNVLVVQAIATMLPAGSVAELAYADRVFQVPVNLVALPLWTSVFPFLSRDWEGGDISGFQETLTWGFRLILLVVAPIAVALIFGSKAVVGVLFMRGAFGPQAAQATALVLTISAIGLIPISLGYLFGRALQATRGMWLFAAVSLLNVALNGFGCVLLSRWWGIAGIAMSGAITFVLSATVLAVILKRRTGVMIGRGQFGLGIKVAIASSGMVCVALGLAHGLNEVVSSHSRTYILVPVGSWFLGLVTYVLCLLLLRVQEVRKAVARSSAWWRSLLDRSWV